MAQTRSFVSRRKLLIGVGGTATAAAALVVSPLRTIIDVGTRNLVRGQPVLRRLLVPLADAGYDQWLEQVGSTFSVGGGQSMKLVAVTALPSSGARPFGSRDRAFLTKFDVQNGGTLAGELIYSASHPTYGPLRIFLSASTDPRLPHRMTAVFN